MLILAAGILKYSAKIFITASLARPSIGNFLVQIIKLPFSSFSIFSSFARNFTFMLIVILIDT